MNTNFRENAYIQIGDKPGWKKPVLNIIFEDEAVSIPITQKVKKQLLKTGKIAVEG